MSPPLRAGIALGANLGDRIAVLRRAFRRLSGISAGPVHCSRVYETEPVGCADGSPWFLNAVCEIGWDGDALDLFRQVSAIETELGRVRDGTMNAPRNLDLDLLYAGDRVVRTAELVLPHPRMLRRRFVLQPLGEIRPDLVLPGQARPVRELLAALEEKGAVRVHPERLEDG